MLVWPDVTYGRKINWKLTYRAIASCVCVGYLLTFLILYGSRAALLPGSWIWEDDWYIWCWSRCGPLWPLSSSHHSPVTSLTFTQPGAFPASAEAPLLCGRTLWSSAMCEIICSQDTMLFNPPRPLQSLRWQPNFMSTYHGSNICLA